MRALHVAAGAGSPAPSHLTHPFRGSHGFRPWHSSGQFVHTGGWPGTDVRTHANDEGDTFAIDQGGGGGGGGGRFRRAGGPSLSSSYPSKIPPPQSSSRGHSPTSSASSYSHLPPHISLLPPSDPTSNGERWMEERRGVGRDDREGESELVAALEER